MKEKDTEMNKSLSDNEIETDDLDKLFDQLESPEIPVELDQTIIAAAQKEVDKTGEILNLPKKWHLFRLDSPYAMAAVIVLSASLWLFMKPVHDETGYPDEGLISSAPEAEMSIADDTVAELEEVMPQKASAPMEEAALASSQIQEDAFPAATGVVSEEPQEFHELREFKAKSRKKEAFADNAADQVEIDSFDQELSSQAFTEEQVRSEPTVLARSRMENKLDQETLSFSQRIDRIKQLLEEQSDQKATDAFLKIKQDYPTVDWKRFFSEDELAQLTDSNRKDAQKSE